MELLLRSLALISGLAPTGFLALFFYARAGGRVSAELMGVGIFFGALSAFFALGFDLAVDASGLSAGDIDNIYLRGVIRAFLGAAVPEEFAKLCVLLFVVMRHEFCDNPEDVLVGAIAVALGFAACENVLYLYEALEKGRLSIVGPARAVLSVPMHAVCGLFMGLFIGKVIGTGSRLRQIVAGYSTAVFLHGLYDAPIMVLGYMKHPETVTDIIVSCALIAAFVLVIVIAGWYGLQRLRVAAAAMPRPVLDGIGFLHRLILAMWLWRVVGAMLLLFGISAAAYAVWGFAHKDAMAAIFILHAFVPAVFGVAMLRLMPPRRAIAL